MRYSNASYCIFAGCSNTWAKASPMARATNTMDTDRKMVMGIRGFLYVTSVPSSRTGICASRHSGPLYMPQRVIQKKPDRCQRRRMNGHQTNRE